MIRANTLHHRAVVDLDAAEKLGEVAEILLDTEAGRVAGFVVSQARGLGGTGRHWVVPAESVYAIGPDALTVRRPAEGAEELPAADGLPRLSRATGLKMISQSGAVLGTLADALLEEQSGRIVAYAFHRGDAPSGLSALFGNRPQQLEYLRSESGLRVGDSLVVVPDDAVVGGEPVTDDLDRRAGGPALRGTMVDWSTSPAEHRHVRAAGGPAEPDEVTSRLDWRFEPSDQPRPLAE